MAFGSGFCYLGVRDNDCSGILFVRKDLAESVPGRPKEEKILIRLSYVFYSACIIKCAPPF